jgi:hypothetical protein
VREIDPRADPVAASRPASVDQPGLGFVRADPTAWPPKNELFFNQAQQPLIENENGIFALTEDGITKNIHASREIFDTTLLAEI